MIEALENLFWILIFPGFVFTLAVGLIASWLVRKVSALVQYRVGPPVYQPLADVMKLMGKEILIPAPLIGLAAVLLLATMLWLAVAGTDFVGDILVALYLMVLPSLALILGSSASGSPHAALTDFVGDILVALYLMVLPSLALILGSSASGSPHAALPRGSLPDGAALAGPDFGQQRQRQSARGPGREPGDEACPRLRVAAGSGVRCGADQDGGPGRTRRATEPGGHLAACLGPEHMAISQHASVLSISGALAFLVALLCVQAKLGFVPFDIAESETEVAGGVIIEYSGALLAVWKLMQAMMLVLAVWKLMQAMMLVALPLFLVVVFLGGIGTSGWSLPAGIGKYVLVLVLVILIKNTNPRVRIDQAMRFFWFYAGITLGNYYGIPWL